MQYSLLTDKILSVIIITCQSRKVNSFSFVLHFAFNEIFHSVSVPPGSRRIGLACIKSTLSEMLREGACILFFGKRLQNAVVMLLSFL